MSAFEFFFSFYGLLLAKQCGLTNPEIAPAIERTSRFFSYYAGRGSIPYGEHEAFWQGHENNGKSGLAAVVFSMQANRAKEQKIFAKMAIADLLAIEEAPDARRGQLDLHVMPLVFAKFSGPLGEREL